MSLIKEGMILSAKGLSKRYGNRLVLNQIELEVSKGEFLTILGPSGAGKSTLLHILGSLEAPDAGYVTLQGTPYHTLRGGALARFRNRHIGFIFQAHHLLPEFSALENVALAAYIANKTQQKAHHAAQKLLIRLGLEERLDARPEQLSGGELQRVAVARALINTPAIVLGDEPTGNLDSKNSQELYELFMELRKDYLSTFILTTHDQTLASGADRVLHIKDGNLCA